MFTNEGKSHVLIKIEDKLLQSSSVFLSFACIRELNSYIVPTLELQLLDTADYLINFKVVQGMKVSVLLAQKVSDNARWIDFRIFSIQNRPYPGQGVLYSITGYYDLHEYLYKIQSKVYDSISSSGLAKLIVQQSGKLLGDIDDTLDVRSWQCNLETLGRFWLKSVVPQSKAQNSGFMMQCLSAFSNTLYYKDIISVVTKPTKWSLINTTAIQKGKYNFLFDQDIYTDNGGLFNKVAYGLKNAVFDMLSGTLSESTRVKATRTDSKLNINKNLLTKSFKTFSPLDFGNSSTGLKDAGTNMRHESTYSVSLDVLVRSYTNIAPFDYCRVDFVSQYNKSGVDTTKSGNYICIGKARVATPNNYAERICMLRNSLHSSSDQLV